MSAAARRAAIEQAAAELPDVELFELHREVSRLASSARLRDPEFRARQQRGYAAARSKMTAYRDIARREDGGQ